MINEIDAKSSGQAITAAPNAISATPAILATTRPCFQLFSTKKSAARLASRARAARVSSGGQQTPHARPRPPT